MDRNEKSKHENEDLEKESIEEMSTSSMIKNESNEIEIQEKARKRIKFGGWLPDVLDWIKPLELAQSSLCTASYTFHQYCYRKLHGRTVKSRIVRGLVFSRVLDGAGNWQIFLQKHGGIRIPVAGIEPPEYIIGFEGIIFWFIDDQVVQFMQSIYPLLNEGIKILFDCELLENNPQIGSIMRLMELLAPKIYFLRICKNNFYDLNKFNRQFSNFIDGVQSIYLFGHWESDTDLVVKWLTTPREDGKRKMLKIDFTNPGAQTESLINRVKAGFVLSTEPINFTIFFRYNLRENDEEEPIEFEDFKIENKTTKEILELQLKEPEKYFLIRHKNEDEIIAKTNWEKEMKLELEWMKFFWIQCL